MVGRRVNYFAVQSIWKITPPPSLNRVLGLGARLVDSFFGLPCITHQYKCYIVSFTDKTKYDRKYY